MKSLLMIAIFLCLISGANAKPSFTNDDRYFNSNAIAHEQATLSNDVLKVIKKKRSRKTVIVKGYFYDKKNKVYLNYHLDSTPISPFGKVLDFSRKHAPEAAPVARFLADAATAAVTPIRALGEAVIHGARPSGCPARAWCGCFLSQHLGLHRRDLWLARNWARIGSPASAEPGAIVVWSNHVGKVVAVAGNKIKVLSGNDGRRVRERWRTMAGVIAFRRI